MSNTPTFSLAYTTVRPAAIPEVIKMWTERSKFKDIEWVICTDGPDTATAEAAIVACENFDSPPPPYPGIFRKHVLQDKEPFNCIRGWNAAAAATTGKVIICVSDDFSPPQDWDEHLLALRPDFLDGEFVVHTEDGYVHDIVVLSILTRKRYEKFGYVFYPQYESMFADTEFGTVAYRDGVMLNAKHLLFEHMHPDCGKRERDDKDKLHASKARWQRGEMLYNFRMARGFPLDDGPNAFADETPAPVKDIQYAAYLQVTKDDFCLTEVCLRLMEEGVNTFFFSVPDEYWSGDPVPKSDIDVVVSIAEKLTEKGAHASVKVYPVKRYRYPGDTRIDVETRVRNDSLRWIRDNGFSNILIVDGDELWTHGTLQVIDSHVKQGHLSLALKMIPVAGLPGYPIDKATDVAVVYVGGNCNFKACRSPSLPFYLIPIPKIIHFTSTRRTMDEIIEKSRASGHYDDPDYEFEDWIKNKLPHIKPGERDIHMYTKHQIWPSARHWRPEELAEIPESLHQFLGT